VDSKELVNLYLDISEGLLSKLSLNNSSEDDFDKYLFILSVEQSLDSLQLVLPQILDLITLNLALMTI